MQICNIEFAQVRSWVRARSGEAFKGIESPSRAGHAPRPMGVIFDCQVMPVFSSINANL